MELASSEQWRIRQATKEDTSEIGRLLGRAALRHLHIDWHLPVDWLGTPGFVLCEQEGAVTEAELLACLAVGADPPPAAWVRVAAVGSGRQSEAYLREMMESMIPWLRENGVSILGWLPEEFWPERWLSAMGLRKVNWIVTYSLEDMAPGIIDSKSVTIRPAKTTELALLAEIEAEAFDPLWRHSANGLLLAFRQAESFEVAEVDGRVVGFQYSVAGQDGTSAHLVRLAVAPDAQGHGVGSALLTAALQGYERMGVEQVTLNTQLDNHASHRLYEHFGFRRVGGRAAVWAMSLDE